jgi:hypothetical protein
MDHVFRALEERLGGLFGARSIVLAGGTRQSRRVQELSRLGARRTLVLTTEDHHPLHDPQQARWLALGTGGGLVAKEQGRLAEVLRNPPDWLRAELDGHDPDGDALVIGSPYAMEPTFAGRPVLNHRRPCWVELENKTTIDALWQELAVDHAPVAVLEPDEDALWRASVELDRGHGVVWSGDGPSINGGANFVRRVRHALHAKDAFDALAPKCEQIRVMPFLEGIPVSIHGLVFPDGTAALRPIEMVVPRRGGSARFLYAGCASYYDPPQTVRDQMRSLARRVGEWLREAVGYRGTFTLDGVATADGFLPTEINTRYGGAMGCLEDALPELLLALVQVALVAGHDLAVSSIEFEETLLAAADRHRSSSVGANVRALRVDGPLRRPVVFADWTCRWAQEGEVPHGMLRLEPGPVGGRLELDLEPDAVPLGRSVAPLTVAAFALADQEWGTGFGALEPAVPMGIGEEPALHVPEPAESVAGIAIA